jgi:hypothetical protein
VRRHPLVPLGMLVAVVAYLMIREAGHLVSLSTMGLAVRSFLQYGILPAFEASPSNPILSPESQALVSLSGPVLALIVGYLLLWLMTKHKRLAGSGPGLIVGFICYLTLIIDPVYYSIVSLLKLGGEPEKIAGLLQIPITPITVTAFGLLVLNTLLLRKWLVPLMRGAR